MIAQVGMPGGQRLNIAPQTQLAFLPNSLRSVRACDRLKTHQTD